MKVLIVDDDSNFCYLIGQELKEYGIEAITTTNTDQALEILSREEFPVLISDIKMETPIAGISFLEHAARINPRMGRLIITGYDHDLKWALQTPGIWRLQKPHNIKDVIIAITRLSEPPFFSEADQILDEIITKIKDTNIDTSKIEAKLNKLVSNGFFGKIESKLDDLNLKIEYHEKNFDGHEEKCQRMEDLFVGKVDNVKLFLKLISILSGVLLTGFGIFLKYYLL